jgi:hypothetical protein
MLQRDCGKTPTMFPAVNQRLLARLLLAAITFALLAVAPQLAGAHGGQKRGLPPADSRAAVYAPPMAGHVADAARRPCPGGPAGTHCGGESLIFNGTGKISAASAGRWELFVFLPAEHTAPRVAGLSPPSRSSLPAFPPRSPPFSS